MYYDKAKTESLGALTFNGANTIVFAPGQPFDAKRAVFVYSVAQTSAAATITYGVRDVDDGNSVTLGTFTLPVAAADSVYEVYLGDAGSGPTAVSGAPAGTVVYEAGSLVVRVNPGQELFFTSDGGGDGGVANVYVEGFPGGFQPDSADGVRTVTPA